MRSLLAALAVLLLAPALGTAASADGPATPAPSLRPPSGVLRHVDAPRASVAPREVVFLVGGYQSCACDATFDALIGRLRAAGFDVRRFGADPRHPYDTYGPVGPNAERLRDEIRSVRGDYGAVHIVTHSMGGVVTDEAFARGLSRDDGVVTYVSWSSPHRTSDLAAALGAARDAFGGDGGAFRDVALLAGHEIESAAIRDLARVRSPVPPEGVVRVELREATDVIVTAGEARASGVPTRTLTRAIEGHAGILSDPDALDLTLRTIALRRVPAEERPAGVVRAAEAVSAGVELGRLGLVTLLVASLILLGWATRTPPLASPLERLGGLRRAILRPARRPCA